MTSKPELDAEGNAIGAPSFKNDGFEFAIGGPKTGFSIFLAERTKKVHFIRHAEGFHNQATRESGSNDILIGNEALLDSRLTPKGVQQCLRLKAELAVRPSQGRSFTHFDLIVVSPLTRTLETAMHIFGPPRKPGIPKFCCELTDRGLPRPQFLVREECRERWGHYMCDKRRPIREIIKDFPDCDFSEVENDEDIFFTDHREPTAHVEERTIQFLEWLNKRPEKCIAVVSHSSFLKHMFQQFGDHQAVEDKTTLTRLAGNCELRSVVLCSHGVKDGRVLKPMQPEGSA